MSKVLNLRKKSTQTHQPAPKQVENNLVEQKNPKISWEAPSFYYNPQKRYLSLTTMALMAAAIALLVLRYDTLTSVFLILASLVLLLYGKQRPTVSTIKVDQSGVCVDDMVYRYNELKSFWIEYNPGGPKELSLESVKWYMPYVKVLLNDQNPVELRSLIINFLPEKEHENSLADIIGRNLGL